MIHTYPPLNLEVRTPRLTLAGATDELLERLVPAPDCGMKYMPRHVAFGKLKAMCDAAAAVRKEIS